MLAGSNIRALLIGPPVMSIPFKNVGRELEFFFLLPFFVTLPSLSEPPNFCDPPSLPGHYLKEMKGVTFTKLS